MSLIKTMNQFADDVETKAEEIRQHFVDHCAYQTNLEPVKIDELQRFHCGAQQLVKGLREAAAAIASPS
jgi:hypothetical protein